MYVYIISFLNLKVTEYASSVYRPNLKQKSDADILRDAKLEAMGLPPQEEPRRNYNNGGTQMATDEAVRMIARVLLILLITVIGNGAFQEEDAQVTRD